VQKKANLNLKHCFADAFNIDEYSKMTRCVSIVDIHIHQFKFRALKLIDNLPVSAGLVSSWNGVKVI
jgi:hypothetical protein